MSSTMSFSGTIVENGVTNIDELWRYAGHLETTIARLREALLQCKHGAEYPDELGNIIDAALDHEQTPT